MSSPELKSLLRRHLLKTVLQYFLRALSLLLLYRKILHTSQVRDQRCLSGLSLCTTNLWEALVTFVMI